MRKILNTLYISNPNRYLALDGETVVIKENEYVLGQVPLHNIETIITFGYTGASPALMYECAKRGITVNFMSSYGKFYARVVGENYGNVHLRKTQYKVSEDKDKSIEIAKNFIIAKIFNSKQVLERAKRDYPLRLDVELFKSKIDYCNSSIVEIRNNTINAGELRGIEGKCASEYFSIFDDLILQQKDKFIFDTRNRRPPLDNVNAMLSFSYTLLTSMCTSALEAVGLDPYVGFFHTDRSGRVSLSLDLIEEFRSCYADRFVLNLINKRILSNSDFTKKENGAIIMKDDARKTFLKHWQDKKSEIITHPFLQEKIEVGMLPYVQALLLSRFLRGDLEEYPPYFWR